MTDELKTKFILEGEARGFDRVQKTVEGVMGVVGGKTPLLSQLDKALVGISTSIQKLEASVSRITKSAQEYDRQTKQRQQGSHAESAHREPNFLRGLLQGAGVGQYLPGVTSGALAAQTAGVGIGRSASGVGRGLVGSAFTGASGLAQAFSSLPGGGAISGMASAAMGAVEDALELQRAQKEAAPFLDYGKAGTAARSRGGAARAQSLARAVAAPAELSEMFGSASKSVAQMNPPVETPADAIFGPMVRTMATKFLADFGNDFAKSAKTAEANASKGVFSPQAQARAAQIGHEAEAQARHEALFGRGFRELGVRHGLDETELTRSAVEVLRGRGGSLDQLQAGGGLRAALAAQSGFGVDLGLSSTLLRGGRIGAGLGGGSEGDQLARMVGESRGLGLEGSEAVRHLQTISEGVQRFEQTGIPIASSSSSAIARNLIHAGMANSVAAGRAQAMTTAIQGRAAQGLPQNATDFAALVHLGGYGGGGPEEALQARSNLVSGRFKAGGMDQLAKLFGGQLGSGPQGRAFGVEMGFKQLGLNLSPPEAAALEARSSGRTLSAEQEAAIRKAESRMTQGPETTEDLEGSVRVGGGLQRQAGIRNRRISAGGTSMAAVQDFEDRAAKAAGSFATVIDHLRVLNPLFDGLEAVLERLIKTANRGTGVQPGP